MDRKYLILFMLLAGVLLFVTGMARADEAVPRITKEELKSKLGSSALAIIDVRGAKAAGVKERMIAGAVREDPAWPEKWAGKYTKDRTLVIYCA